MVLGNNVIRWNLTLALALPPAAGGITNILEKRYDEQRILFNVCISAVYAGILIVRRRCSRITLYRPEQPGRMSEETFAENIVYFIVLFLRVSYPCSRE